MPQTYKKLSQCINDTSSLHGRISVNKDPHLCVQIANPHRYLPRRGDRGAPRDCYQGNKKILVAALLTSLIYVSTNKSCYQGVTGHFTGFCTDNGYCMYCNKYRLVFRREIVTRVSMKFSWRRVSSLYCLPFCYQGITEILVAAK